MLVLDEYYNCLKKNDLLLDEKLSPLSVRSKEKVELIDKEYGCYMSVDSTATPVERPMCNYKRKKLWSAKHASCNYKYECAVGNKTGKCYWISGPHYGSVHDFKIIKNSGLLKSLDKKEILFGDKGVKVILEDEKLNFYMNHFVSSYHIIVENYFSQLKKWKVLTQPWRSTESNHKKVFFILVYITNLKIDETPLRNDHYFIDTTDYENDEEDNEPINCICYDCTNRLNDDESEDEITTDSESEGGYEYNEKE
ncbi:hypothetical protein ACTFIW_010067 [Dictyostelium discoideum]